MSNSVFLVIVVGIVLAMLVMMVRYARFIHNYPSQAEKDLSEKDKETKTSPEEPEKDA